MEPGKCYRLISIQEGKMSRKGLESMHLMLANEHIMMAEKYIEEQEIHIKHLVSIGCDTTRVEQVLLIFYQTLEVMHTHRNESLVELEE
jgi:hypothetical protein